MADMTERFVQKSVSLDPIAAIRKSHEDAPAMTFSALVSKYGVLDSQGEYTDAGAFKSSLEARDTYPIVYAHNWDDPFAVLGVAKCHDTDEGLVMEATLDPSNSVAKQVYHLMELGLVQEFSYGAAVKDAVVDEDGHVHLTDVDLIEASICLKGANPETEVLSLGEKGAKMEETATKAETEETVLKEADMAALASALLSALKEEASKLAPEPETEPEPEPEPKTPEPSLADVLRAQITEGLDLGETPASILQGVVDTLDSQMSGDSEEEDS